MPYFSDLNTYLHQSSLLIKAYPNTRITTKYSLPRKHKDKAKFKTNSAPTEENANTNEADKKSKREPSASLTLKTFHPESGICLKYRTDKAAEAGRLINGLGRLAKGEDIDMPSITTTAPVAEKALEGGGGDKMDVDSGGTVLATAPKQEDKVATAVPTTQQTASGGGGGKGSKKKKEKK